MQIARGRSGPLSRRMSLTFVDRIALVETFLNWTAVYVSRAVGLGVPILSLAFNIHPFQTSLDGLAVHFLPYWLWSGLTMHWLSGGRIVPILSDVSQIIVLPQILKAVFVGLWRPQGHKFQVTAKGGDRGRGFVEWGHHAPLRHPDRRVDPGDRLCLLHQRPGGHDPLFGSRPRLVLVQSAGSRRAVLRLHRAAAAARR